MTKGKEQLPSNKSGPERKLQDFQNAEKAQERKNILSLARGFIQDLVKEFNLKNLIRDAKREAIKERKRLAESVEKNTSPKVKRLNIFSSGRVPPELRETKNFSKSGHESNFEEISTDKIQSTLDVIFPQLRNRCKNHPLGKNIPRDIVEGIGGLVYPVVESVNLVFTLVWHAGKFVLNPKKQFQITREFWK